MRLTKKEPARRQPDKLNSKGYNLPKIYRDSRNESTTYKRFNSFAISFGPAGIITGVKVFAVIGGILLLAALILKLYQVEWSD